MCDKYFPSLQLYSINIHFANKPTYLTGLDVFLFSVQVLIGTDSITNLHKLEQVSSDEGIGTLAENLLEALREHSDVNLKIEAARRETRAEKKRMAMAMRQKALGTLGMTVLYSSILVLSFFLPAWWKYCSFVSLPHLHCLMPLTQLSDTYIIFI